MFDNYSTSWQASGARLVQLHKTVLESTVLCGHSTLSPTLAKVVACDRQWFYPHPDKILIMKGFPF